MRDPPTLQGRPQGTHVNYIEVTQIALVNAGVHVEYTPITYHIAAALSHPNTKFSLGRERETLFTLSSLSAT